MSETTKVGWLQNKDGDPISPNVLTECVKDANDKGLDEVITELSNEVYIGDSLPSGVQPDLWIKTNEDYSGGIFGEFYSENEQVIGTWLGKPLYRKVFKGTSASTSQTSGSRYQVEIPLSSSNDFDFIKSVEGWLRHSSGTKINVTTLGLASSGINTNIYTRVTNGQPLLSFQTNVSNVVDGYKSQPYEIALEYTKTTD